MNFWTHPAIENYRQNKDPIFQFVFWETETLTNSLLIQLTVSKFHSPPRTILMNPILVRILTSIGSAILSYAGMAAVLILIGVAKKKPETNQESNMSFKELYFSYDGLPKLQNYTARDGATLDYRHYPAKSAETVLILLHGSGWHSQYFLPLAEHISGQNLAHAYTPDLRGHGKNPVTRGDVDYLTQYDDDIADFIAIVRETHPGKTLIMGGHSSGGGLALRFGGSKYGQQADAYLLMSPFLKYNAPTARKDSGGWATPYNGRIAGLVMLNNVGIRAFNHLEVIRFNMPEEAQDGTETLTYTHRLNTAYAPKNYKKDLAKITQPLLVLVGRDDEAFLPEQYPPTITRHNSAAQVELIPGVNHQGIVVGDAAYSSLDAWITGLK
jgi:non-heme chloroperoxidase